jgi:hypothetical protein
LEAYSQTRIGLNFTEEYTVQHNFRPGMGAIFERQFAKHSGLETGLYLRTEKIEWLATLNQKDVNLGIVQMYCSLPILYKLYTKHLNIAAGPTIDYFAGWYQIDGKPEIDIYTASPSNKFCYTMLVKVSKPIQLSDKIWLEPEIRYSNMFRYSNYYLGIGIAAKYQF